MERLRLQLEEAERKAKSLEEMQRQAAASQVPRSHDSRFFLQPLCAASSLKRRNAVVAYPHRMQQGKLVLTLMYTSYIGRSAQERSSGAAAAAAAAVAAPEHLDGSVRAFIKLKELQPQQAALLAQLEKAGELSEDDQECLDFITDEIQRLMDELHEFGFSFPECALCYLQAIDLLLSRACKPPYLFL